MPAYARVKLGDLMHSTTALSAHRAYLVQQSTYVVDEQKLSATSPRTAGEHRRRDAEPQDRLQSAKRDQLALPSVNFGYILRH